MTSTKASPAAVFAGDDESLGEPHVSRLTPSVSASSGPLSGDVELEAWVTAVTLEDYNSPRSNRSATDPDDTDSDGDGVDDEVDVRETALELERKLLSQTTAAADSISKRSARTGRSQLADMGNTIEEVQATVARCSDDVCRTVLENAEIRGQLVRQAQDNVENGEWDDAAVAVDEILEIVEGDIERLESGSNPLYEAETRGGENPLAEGLAPPGGDPLSDEQRAALGEYLSGSPTIGERFTVCLPDAEVPGGNGSLAREVTPRRFIDYITGRAAADGDGGKVYAWGARAETASGNGGGDCDDRDTRIRPDDVCTPRHLRSAVSGPHHTGGGLRSARTDVGVTVVNDPPRAEAGTSILVCPVDGEAFEPSDLTEWGPESGASSETPTIVCQVMVRPPECPVPIRALLYVKRCRSAEQLVYTGGWVLDAAGLYEGSVTALTVAGETQVVDIECCFDFSTDRGGDGYADLVSRSVSGERARRGARVETGTVSALIEAGTLSEDTDGEVYCWGDGSRSRDDAGSCGETDEAGGEIVVTHCPLDAPVLHLVNAGSASNEVKFKAGAELSKSVS
ncbi:hypothetical protein ACOZ35_08235 [Halorubrum xinjiangense]|uniref:hypothetical protein n=1 Tax=Halorubrum xinjiangense TaxID=261291 RepID=UPI003C6EC770